MLNLKRPVQKRKEMHHCVFISDLSDSTFREVAAMVIYFIQKKKPRLRVVVRILEGHIVG